MGSNVGISVLEMIALVEQISGMHIPYELIERRVGDLSIVFADAAKLTKKSSWQSKRSLFVSVKSAWDFIKREVE